MTTLLLLAALASGAEVTVWHSYSGAEQAALEQVADDWQASHPDDRVSLVALPFGGFDTKVDTAIPRGNGPDLFIAAHGNVAKWVREGVIEPWTAETTGIASVGLDAFTIDEQLWGLPIATKSLVLLYDPSRIATPPQTTDELLEMARAETGEGHYGLAYQAADPYFHAPWMHGFGAAAMDDEGTVSLDGDAQVRSFAFARRLAVDEGIAPTQPTGELVSRLYEDGNVTFVISGPWFTADLSRPVAAAPFPIVSETGLPARPYLTVDGIYRAKGAPSPELAQDLAWAIASAQGAQTRQDVGGQAVTWTATTGASPLVETLRTQAETAIPMPTHPDISSVWEAQAYALRRVMRGSASPERAGREAQARFEQLQQKDVVEVSRSPYIAALGVFLLGMVAALVLRLRNPTLRNELAATRWDYLWIGPAAFAMLALVVTPFVLGAAVSLYAYQGGEWTFVGLAHFADILLSRDFPITSPMSFFYTLAVTILWTVTNLILHVSIGVALALVLREPWIRMRGMWRALLILPWAVPNYITALIWKSMFHAQYGAINKLLALVTPGPGPVEFDWFAQFSTSFAANLATNTWLGFPFMMVVTLGALQAIPKELEEAAEVDGAGYLTRLRHVVWPLLRPALLPAILLGSVWTFNMFNVVYLVSAGEPDGSTEILISEAYRWAFSRNNQYGYAAAYAVLIFGVLLVYSRAANRLVGRKVL
ncbi:MAG: arabinogalactan oligomer/maltooligosaccharide transport system permease protein [Myxococcota bacterium]|jgi:arabinogalactan oligomer/maltooligosaccharide transport system permease protein